MSAGVATLTHEPNCLCGSVTPCPWSPLHTRPGAEGNTYLVRDVSDGRKWAIKLINLPLPTRMIKSLYRQVQRQDMPALEVANTS